ncbi:efflux RND transporter permease subunit [Nitrospira moscoviensis]|uniref:RND-type permease AcrB n=1 Tax=Nitrospira moscoviensis TaxID=42253 RepID=A0A0K2GAM3_NITMO|nr:efflux RND transporter permease subunit [Nitrospira moscoviensis]ALA57904.1 RND-type permease AcrB [Nitrospira moscoviensis]
MLTRAALKNPYAVFALCTIALVLGAVSYKKMRVDIFPEIKIPTILVTTFYRGLSPTEMEGAITLKMEQRFVEASYVEHIESQSLAGMSYIKVFFQPEYGIDAAQSELTSLAYSIIRLLPPGVYPPSVYKFGVSSLPVGLLSISSETLGPKEIRDLAYFTVRQQIATIPGISFGPPLGGKVRQITVFMDQQRMLARGISPSEVVKAINAQSAIIPAGNIKIGDLDYYVYSNSLIDLVDKINDIPIKVVNGTPILIRDIGTAADSAAIQTSIVRVNGREATYIPITRQEGANTLEVTDGIRAKLPKLTEIPANTTVKFIYDQSLYIRQAIANLQKEGLLGAGLAGLMIFLFLRSIKAALVVGLAIPLSLTAALVALYLTGQTVNIMTLGGLALVIGTLLDNNIVVQENLHRHLEMGKDGRSAAEDSATELTLPIFVATVCILIVYLPIVFFSGIIKYLFVPLAMTVAFAMSADYAVSMSVTPVVLARLYRRGAGHEAGGEGDDRNDWFRFVLALYEPVLRFGVRFKAAVIVAALLALLGTAGLLLPRLHTEFFPKVDAGNFTMIVSAPEGSRIEKTTAIVAQIEQLVQETIPKHELEEVISNTGLYFGDAARFAPNTGNHTAFVLVNLVTGHEGRTEDYVNLLRARLREHLPGVEVSFQTGGIISDVLNFGLRAPIDIQVKGPSLNVIRPVAEEIREKVARVADTTDVRIKQGKNYPELHMNVDRTKAAYYGITQDRVIVDVITGISSNLALSPNYWLDPKTANGYFLLAQYPEQSLTKTEDLLNIPIIGARTSLAPTASLTTAGLSGSSIALQNTPFAGRALDLSNGFYASGDERRGPPVLLRDVASLQMKTGPDSVDHYDLSRLIDVLVTPVGNDLGRVAKDIERVLAGVTLPKDVTVDLKGEVANMRAAFGNFALALPLAVLLIYLVMVGLFRSFVDPLIILVAVPLGWIGTVLMLHFTNTSVNVESMIGTLMMMGIVVSNSILLVDFANRMADAGADAERAVLEAGRRRIRPILMTALATILGLLPLALGFGEGNETMVPLARAVVGGLAVSTIMTLFVVPVMHAMVLSRRTILPGSETPAASFEGV